jgi:RNA recognition motif-containing protein
MLLLFQPGQSTGVAHVFFLDRSGAERAFRKYNGVPLDGRPMFIDLKK